MRLATLGLSVSIGLAGCVGVSRSPVDAPAAAGRSDSSYYVRRDADVVVPQPGPHAGTGQTTAYRYFDDVAGASMEFRKRALHAGASIGEHVLTHDEVYYVLSGRGELTVDRERIEVGPQTAVFMRLGANVGLRQLGAEDLVIIIAYPAVRAP